MRYDQSARDIHTSCIGDACLIERVNRVARGSCFRVAPRTRRTSNVMETGIKSYHGNHNVRQNTTVVAAVIAVLMNLGSPSNSVRNLWNRSVILISSFDS